MTVDSHHESRRLQREAIRSRVVVEANARSPVTHDLVFLEARLSQETASIGATYPPSARSSTTGSTGTCSPRLAAGRTRLVALRSAGFNNVNVEAARRSGIAVARVPGYSPYAVAEHTLALILTLERKLHRALNRVRDGNFSLEGLLGTELHGSTVGIVGTARSAPRWRASSPVSASPCWPPMSSRTRSAPRWAFVMFRSTTFFVPPTWSPSTAPPFPRHAIFWTRRIATMRPNALVVNTSRGALIDTAAVVDALKLGHLRGLAIDVV